MKKLIVLMQCICITSPILAQANTDSLFRILNFSPSDTTRILTQIRLADELKRSKPDTALFLVNTALQNAETMNYKKGIAAALNSKGYLVTLKGNVSESNLLHQRALEIGREIENFSEQARSYTGFGQVAQINGEYNLMKEYFLKALTLNIETAFQRPIASSYTNVASAYGSLAMYDSCLFYQFKAIKILEALNDHTGLTKAYSNVGAVFLNTRNFIEALKYLRLALGNCEISNDKNQQTHILNLIGQSYFELKNNDEAVLSYEKSIQLAKELGKTIYVGRGLQGLGDIEDEKGNYKSAVNNYQQAYEVAKGLNSAADLILLPIKIATVLNKSGEHKEALYYLDLAKQSPSINESLDDKMNLYEEFYKTYALLGDYKSAYPYLLLHTEIKDSLVEIKQTEAVEQLKLTYETGKKDQQISLLNLQNQNKERQRNSLILVSVLLGVSLVTLFLVFRQRMQISKLKEAERSRKQMQLLRTAIAQDLHDDIGSTLSSIAYYSEAIRKMIREDKSEIIPLLEKMEKASDKTVEAMSDIVWAINPSLDMGTNLTNRMNSYAVEMAGLKNIQLMFETDPSFEESKIKMDARKNIYLIFKEAVNNAVKYSGCTILNIYIGSNMMHVEDNGKSFDTNKEFTGNGLKNMKQRANEIKGILEVKSEQNKGTSVILKL